MFAAPKYCADPTQLFPAGHVAESFTLQSWAQDRDPRVPMQVSPAPQFFVSHSSPTWPGPICSHPAVPSFTTAQVVFPVHVPVGPPARSVHSRMGTQTGTENAPDVTGWTSQNAKLVTTPASITSPQVGFPPQQ
jgi:hypothetical protein